MKSHINLRDLKHGLTGWADDFGGYSIYTAIIRIPKISGEGGGSGGGGEKGEYWSFPSQIQTPPRNNFGQSSSPFSQHIPIRWHRSGSVDATSPPVMRAKTGNAYPGEWVG
jgi:hypothetical protein